MLEEKIIYRALYETDQCLKKAMYAYQSQNLNYPAMFQQLKAMCLQIVSKQNIGYSLTSDGYVNQVLESFKQVGLVLGDSVNPHVAEFQQVLSSLDAKDNKKFLTALNEWILVHLKPGAKISFRQSLQAALRAWPENLVLPPLVNQSTTRSPSVKKTPQRTPDRAPSQGRATSRSPRSAKSVSTFGDTAKDNRPFAPVAPPQKASQGRPDFSRAKVRQVSSLSPSALSDLTELDSYGYTSHDSQSTELLRFEAAPPKLAKPTAEKPKSAQRARKVVASVKGEVVDKALPQMQTDLALMEELNEMKKSYASVHEKYVLLEQEVAVLRAQQAVKPQGIIPEVVDSEAQEPEADFRALLRNKNFNPFAKRNPPAPEEKAPAVSPVAQKQYGPKSLYHLLSLYQDKLDADGNVVTPAMATFDAQGNFVLDHERLQATVAQVIVDLKDHERDGRFYYQALKETEYDISRYLRSLHTPYSVYALNRTEKMENVRFPRDLDKAFEDWQKKYASELANYLNRRPQIVQAAEEPGMAETDEAEEVIELHTAEQKNENLKHFYEVYQAKDDKLPIVHFTEVGEFFIDYPRLHAYVDALAIPKNAKDKFKQKIESLVNILQQKRDLSAFLDDFQRELRKVFRSYMVDNKAEEQFWIDMRAARVLWASYYDHGVQNYTYNNLDGNFIRPATPQRRGAMHQLRQATLLDNLQRSPFYEVEDTASTKQQSSGRRLSVADMAQAFKSDTKLDLNFVCDIYRSKTIAVQDGVSTVKTHDPAFIRHEQDQWVIQYARIESVLKALCSVAKLPFAHVQQRFAEFQQQYKHHQDIKPFLMRLNEQIYGLLATTEDLSAKATFTSAFKKWEKEHKDYLGTENDHRLSTASALTKLFPSVEAELMPMEEIDVDTEVLAIPDAGSSHAETSIENENRMPIEGEQPLLAEEVEDIKALSSPMEETSDETVLS